MISAADGECRDLAAAVSGGVSERVALRTPKGNVVLSYRALADEVTRLASLLAGAEVRRGDRVAIVVARGIDFVPLLLAVTRIGACAAPLNPAYTSDEYRFYLDDLNPRLLIVAEDEGTAVRDAARALDVIVLGRSPAGLSLHRGSEAIAPRKPLEQATKEDIALLLHTSGTTSRPKQVPLLHRNLIASARTIAEHYELGSADISFAAMPLFHVHGLVASVLGQLTAGGTAIVPDALSARDFWTTLAGEAVTWFSGSPTILAMLLDRRPAAARASALRFVRSCSAPLPSNLADRCELELSVPVLQAYGMTEASHQIASNPLPPGSRDHGSVGIATGTQVTALAPAGHELPRGTAGEIAVRGPGVIDGYLNNPEANAAAFSDGWFRTGDLGMVDDAGHIWLQGRLKEMINRGGEKISPYEVEEALRAHPAVLDAACFPLPDDKYGEVVGAAVVTREVIGEKHLLDHCARRLAPFKLPRRMHFLDSLPRTATGKVSRYRLAAELAPPHE